MQGGPSSEAVGEGAELELGPELKALLAELVVEAGREQPEPAMTASPPARASSQRALTFWRTTLKHPQKSSL